MNKVGKFSCKSTVLGYLVLILLGCSQYASPYGLEPPNPDSVDLLDLGPCWNNICPEQTPLEEAGNILDTLSLLDSSQTIKPLGATYFSIGLDEIRFGENDYIRINHNHSIVNQVVIYGEWHLTQIISYLGEPTWLVLSSNCGTDIATPYYSFTLWYDSKGLTVFTDGFYTKEPADLVLKPNLFINKIVYHANNISIEMWEQVADVNWKHISSSNTYKYLYTWPGWENSLPSYIDGCK